MTLGSLFDGIGGFPLAAQRHGITTIWASEIEPFPIKVTKLRFPSMKHYGDITKMDGASIEPVDIVSGGSPCQDLSVAGKRAGLEGERSGLFIEQVRIIREMRACYGDKPRYMVWENVPGAFSSAGSEDFRAVLEETARIAESDVSIPRPADGRWSTAGAILADGWSIAWRVLDAQFWGVPQRRRRIFLVADFGGQTAPEILFERKSLSGDIAEGGEARQGAAEGTEGCIETVKCYDPGEARLRTPSGNNVPAVTLQIRSGKEGGGKGPLIQTDQSATLGTGNTQVCFQGHQVICLNDQGGSVMDVSDQAATLRSEAHGHVPKVYASSSYGKYEEGVGSLRAAGGDLGGGSETLVARTVSSKWAKGSGGPAGDEVQNLVYVSYAVRRLTPLECERLQGFPDGWTDIEGATDTARYKALGNSVAIPCVEYVMRRIKEVS